MHKRIRESHAVSIFCGRFASSPGSFGYAKYRKRTLYGRESGENFARRGLLLVHFEVHKMTIKAKCYHFREHSSVKRIHIRVSMQQIHLLGQICRNRLQILQNDRRNPLFEPCRLLNSNGYRALSL